jgi:hypothetical protein
VPDDIREKAKALSEADAERLLGVAFNPDCVRRR